VDQPLDEVRVARFATSFQKLFIAFLFIYFINLFLKRDGNPGNQT
jgi:hypothetical protein